MNDENPTTSEPMDENDFLSFENALCEFFPRSGPRIMALLHEGNENRRDLAAATQLLKDVYDQIGNHRPAERRHVITPGVRDAIRDFIKWEGRGI